MKYLYHLTMPHNPFPHLEAVWQEASLLERHFGGRKLNVNPDHLLPLRIPRKVFGLHLFFQLLKLDRLVRLHHVFHPTPYCFPYLHLIKKPVIFSVVGGLQERFAPPAKKLGRLAACIIVADNSQKQILKRQGFPKVEVVRPSIDLQNLVSAPLPWKRPITILMASAPWNKRQFASKGITLLLDAAQKAEWMRLIFLWRGVLTQEMRDMIHERRLQDRVQLIDREVRIGRELSKSHLAALMVSDNSVVKSFPNSLMETLAAGRPVLTSKLLPMGKLVQERGCGVALGMLTPGAVIAAVEDLGHGYEQKCAAARDTAGELFSQKDFLSRMESIYSAVSVGGQR
jgi:hypothetical protein